MASIHIAGRPVGPGHPTFIVAELSANHLGRLDVALDIVRAAAEAGADGFKLQTLTPDTMTIDCDEPPFVIGGGTAWDGRTLYDLYSEVALPYEWHEPIFALCSELGLVGFSTPYDRTAVDFLSQFDPPAFKIASFEIFDLDLIGYAARHGKPMILSTGIADFEAIREAVDACHAQGNHQVILLKCTSSYPAPYDQIHLRTMQDMAHKFGVAVGVSDHTLGPEVALASVALGGSFIEKHVCLDRSLGGPDAGFSMNPAELAAMVKSVRRTEALLGEVRYELPPASRKSLAFARSLFFVRDLPVGSVVSAEDVRSIRPGHGLRPKFLPQVLGRTLLAPVRRGTPVSWEVLEGGGPA